MLDFYKGMDLSFVPEYLDNGLVTYDLDGTPLPPLALAKKYGVNSIRLRIWHSPERIPESRGYCSLSHTLAMAKQIKEYGLHFLLDFHYSDYWADPAQQRKPKDWENYSFEELKEAVFHYTKDTLAALKRENALPDMVQIGNEIRSGFLFPDGEVPHYSQMVELINAGIDGAREIGGNNLQIMIHLDQGGRYFYLKEWLDNVFDNGIRDFDVLGLSYYPFWHGTFTDLKETMSQLIERYHKPIILAETAHAWRLSQKGFIDKAQEKIAGIPATPQGQKKVLDLVMNITASLPHKMGMGIYYWEPFCLPKEGEGGWAENMGLLDPNGRVMEGIESFLFTREKSCPQKIAKIYEPHDIEVLIGENYQLPVTLNALYYDGSIRALPVYWTDSDISCSWTQQAGTKIFNGKIKDWEQSVTIKVIAAKKIDSAKNLLTDTNWEQGLTCWNIEKSKDTLSQIHPDFVEPFPAPPINALRIESVKNFHFSLSQELTRCEKGNYLLTAEYLGTDTTNVDIRLYLEDEHQRKEIIIHPTEHEWQTFSVLLEKQSKGFLRAGLQITAPPVYGMVRKFTLIKR